jgi:hypothetical protein
VYDLAMRAADDGRALVAADGWRPSATAVARGARTPLKDPDLTESVATQAVSDVTRVDRVTGSSMSTS